MTDTIRTFVAIELPYDVKEALSGLIDALRAANVRGLRPVRPEGIHLTLKFLGDVPQSQVTSIVESVTTAAGDHPRFRLELAGVGAFPNQNRPRVLWAGVEGDTDNLKALQKRIDDALAGLGFEREKRAFNAHLTLARLREEATATDRQKAYSVLSEAPLARGLDIPADSVSLMQSTLKPDGAIYDCLASMPLLRDSAGS